MRRAVGQLGFSDGLVRGSSNKRLERIDELLDWAWVERLLAPIYASPTGRPSYPPLLLWKVLLLEHWYGLGDPEMEEALDDRRSFRRFVGLSLEDAVPDHSTISRFRSELVRRGLGDALFGEVVRQLGELGMVLRQGTLIDATLVRGGGREPSRQKGGGRSAADPEARWTKRPGGYAFFGYKLHVAMDRGSTIVRAARLTPANVNECDHGHELVQGDERAVWADKGYVGPRMRERLRALRIKDRVQHKASRVRALSARQHARNQAIARVRGRIEAMFGTLKRHYGLTRLRYMGLARNTLSALVTLTAWNLARAADRAT